MEVAFEVLFSILGGLGRHFVNLGSICWILERLFSRLRRMWATVASKNGFEDAFSGISTPSNPQS